MYGVHGLCVMKSGGKIYKLEGSKHKAGQIGMSRDFKMSQVGE